MKKPATPRPRPKLTPALLHRLNTALARQKREVRAKVQAEKREKRDERRHRAVRGTEIAPAEFKRFADSIPTTATLPATDWE